MTDNADLGACEHFYAWSSPAGTKLGVGVCIYCHMPSADDLEKIQRYIDDWRELEGRMNIAIGSLNYIMDETVDEDRRAHLKSKIEGVKLVQSYVFDLHRTRHV